MRRANDLLGVSIGLIVTLPALLAGCLQGDPPLDSDGRAAFDNSAVESKELPEVVITASRPKSKATVSSGHEPGSVSH
jgi:hypothetical protein